MSLVSVRRTETGPKEDFMNHDGKEERTTRARKTLNNISGEIL